MGMSNAEIGALARQLGHDEVALVQRGSRWGASCSCGWESREPYWLVAPAISEAQYHLKKAVKDHLDAERRNGRVSVLVKGREAG